MENAKTGALIRELRREKEWTQKELAERLHITDRAVSKWERGLSAPDIALLEPLSRELGISVVELIRGEKEAKPDVEESSRDILSYSQNQMQQKVRRVRRDVLGKVIACAAALLILLGWMVWRGGYLFVLEKKPSPDGSVIATVYNKGLTSGGFALRDSVSIIEREVAAGVSWSSRVEYGNSEYLGLWWAPNSEKYVLALRRGEETQLSLVDIRAGNVTNLSAVLSFGVEATELGKYGYANETGLPKVEYQFLQWGLDSESMLIYYSFFDAETNLHCGYFWYNCEIGEVNAILEMDM